MVRAVSAWSEIARIALRRLRPIVLELVETLSDRHFGSHAVLRDLVL